MKNNFEFKKRFGQNFLRDDSIPKKIVQYSDIPDGTLVIEIGPGAGALTRQLAPVCQNVLAYEIDTSLRSSLDSQFESVDNVEIIYDDFLKRSVSQDLEKYQYQHLYVIANLPYYITTPILMKLIDDSIPIEKIVVMVQKEVGDRFCSQPSSKDYGSITVFLNYYFEIRKLFVVSRNCFVPKPNVDSVILSLTRRSVLPEVKDQSLFFQLIKDSFQFKRKNLKNNLHAYDLEKVLEVLKTYQLDLSVRAEELPVQVFVDISNNL